MCIKDTVSKPFFILIASILFISCKSQTGSGESNSTSKIKVGFIVNDSSFIIDSPFEIVVKKLNDSLLYRDEVINDSIVIPDNLWNAADYFKVVVSYKSNLLSFDSVSSTLAKPTKGMHWEFGIEKKPFLVVGSIVPPDMTKNDLNLKEIYFWRFYPYEGYVKHIIKKVY
ncbi:MAG: hypothetical protein J7578_14785 [Chitinophagaceae bacterium]|nr:hypothetical protein [Chitinophagaceae bacterium]